MAEVDAYNEVPDPYELPDAGAGSAAYRDWAWEIRLAAQRLRHEREVLDLNEQILHASRAEWDAANGPLMRDIDLLTADCRSAEAELRALALEAYRATGDKRPGPGVAVKMVTKLVYDAENALLWARTHRLALLPERLDVLAFETFAKSMAKNGTPFSFVDVEQFPRVDIATDLDKALE